MKSLVTWMMTDPWRLTQAIIIGWSLSSWPRPGSRFLRPPRGWRPHDFCPPPLACPCCRRYGRGHPLQPCLPVGDASHKTARHSAATSINDSWYGYGHPPPSRYAETNRSPRCDRRTIYGKAPGKPCSLYESAAVSPLPELPPPSLA